VCNFLELSRQTGKEPFRDLALRLVDAVHNVLGRHRADDSRTGWISGLDKEQGRLHPTRGGLRIGKELKERPPAEALDEQLEWDRDGQYYHYLTKWMHALNRVSTMTGDSTYNIWAIELAKTAHARFTYGASPGHPKRMYWKMSIDLSRPLVRSMGHHDPLDGLITYNQLQASAAKDAGKSTWLDLRAEIREMAAICEGQSWGTDDALGIGGLLADAYKVGQMVINGGFEQPWLLGVMLESAIAGLESYARNNSLRLPADYRLAFREVGLCIGLHAVEKLQDLIERNPGAFKEEYRLNSRIERLLRYAPLHQAIETFWLESASRESNSWIAHREINMVTLATSLAPDGYLTL
jgi:hypothetical protein